jgi:phage-related protein
MTWQVEFYIDADGNEPVKEFILAQSKGTIAEILHVFKLLREFNIGLGMPYVKKIDKSGLRELRIKHSSNIYRIFFFAYIGQKFILVHALMKKLDTLPEGDKRLALERMREYMFRNPGSNAS